MFEMIPWNQNNQYSPLQEMESFLGKFNSIGFHTDIRDQKDSFLLIADLPGVKKEDISVQLDQNYMTIQARRQSHTQRSKNESERQYSSYSRSFDISGIKTDQISAKYENGSLEILLPKKETATPSLRKLDIQS